MECICNGVELRQLEKGGGVTKMSGAAVQWAAERDLAPAEAVCRRHLGKMRPAAARD